MGTVNTELNSIFGNTFYPNHKTMPSWSLPQHQPSHLRDDYSFDRMKHQLTNIDRDMRNAQLKLAVTREKERLRIEEMLLAQSQAAQCFDEDFLIQQAIRENFAANNMIGAVNNDMDYENKLPSAPPLEAE